MIPLYLRWAEIGVFKGEFSDKILEHCRPASLHLVDPWVGRWCNGGKDGNYDEWIDDLEMVYHQLQRRYNDSPEVVLWRSTSDDYFHQMNTYAVVKPLDVVYIDGLHDYESVKKDLNNALNVTARYILGHDYISPRFSGVVDAVDEFCQENKLKVSVLTKDGCPSYLIKL